MAHCQKFPKGSAGRIIGHCEREKSEHGEYLKYRTSSDIDTSRTHMNMPMRFQDGLTAQQRFEKRLQEVYVLNRKDVNVLCDWVVTLPEELPQDKETLRNFFGETVKFLNARYGSKNVVSCNIHMDEAQPHLHYCFVPVVYDKKKERYKVSAKEVINRADLNSFHTDLENHLHDTMGLEKGLIFSGVTAKQGGNKTIKQLKNELKEVQNAVDQQRQHLNFITQLQKEQDDTAAEMLPEPKKTPIGTILSSEQWEVAKSSFDGLKRKLEAHIAKIAELSTKINTLQEDNRKLKANNTALKKENSELKKTALYKDNEILKAENWSLCCERGELKEKYEQQLRQQEKEFNKQLDAAYRHAEGVDKKYSSTVHRFNDTMRKKDKVIELICRDKNISPSELKKYEQKTEEKPKKKQQEYILTR